MSTPALLANGKLQMGMQIRGGPWKIVPLERQYVNPALVFANERQAVRAASYQLLADRIINDRDWNDSREIFVTSPDEGDGKTTTAFNLAWALSTRTKPVLLAELNLGRPRLRAMLGEPRIRYGVDCALRGIATEWESVFSLVSDDLYVAAVRDAMNRTEVKRFHPLFNSFLNWARKQYQWVVLDCPSVLSRGWNDWFRESAHSTMLIVRSEKTPAVNVSRAVRCLDQSLKGVVLNGKGIVALNS